MSVFALKPRNFMRGASNCSELFARMFVWTLPFPTILVLMLLQASGLWEWHFGGCTCHSQHRFPKRLSFIVLSFWPCFAPFRWRFIFWFGHRLHTSRELGCFATRSNRFSSIRHLREEKGTHHRRGDPPFIPFWGLRPLWCMPVFPDLW